MSPLDAVEGLPTIAKHVAERRRRLYGQIHSAAATVNNERDVAGGDGGSRAQQPWLRLCAESQVQRLQRGGPDIALTRQDSGQSREGLSREPGRRLALPKIFASTPRAPATVRTGPLSNKRVGHAEPRIAGGLWCCQEGTYGKTERNAGRSAGLRPNPAHAPTARAGLKMTYTPTRSRPTLQGSQAASGAVCAC